MALFNLTDKSFFRETSCFIHWTEIYPVDRVIHFLNNWFLPFLLLDEAFFNWWLVYVKRLIFHINFVDRSVETLLACVHGLVLWLFSTAWTKKFYLSRYRNIKVFPLNTFGFDTNSAFSIFVWPWNEYTRTKQKQHMNENRAIWLVNRADTNARGFWSVQRTLGWKNVMP